MNDKNPAVATVAPTMPKQIPFIIANEGCERFSFYGMRNILTVFLMTSLLLSVPEELRKGEAKEVFHTFVIGVYFFPLLGGWLADRCFGKYNTILWLSLVYCGGHACLALFEHSKTGFYTGLFLIALGSGGIKPLVASFMGDQFDQSNRSLAQKVFDGFYWIINFGSFFASLLMPIFLKKWGASVAFGIPGILMAIATFAFWMGRHRYVRVAPVSHDPHGFLVVIRDALRAQGSTRTEARPGLWLLSLAAILSMYCLWSIPQIGIVAALCLVLVLFMGLGGAGAWQQLDRVRGLHSDEAIEGVRNVLRLLVLFALITPFWSLFDQKASTWVLQADHMSKPEGFESSMMQALNPALVMILIPFNNFILYPILSWLGVKVTALRRIGAGIAATGVAWIVVAALQLTMDSGTTLSILWQILPYALMTFGEVLVSATGLEFAYSQAPISMKGVITSFWYLSVTVGNLWVLLANSSVKSESVVAYIQTTGMSVTAFQMAFFALFCLAAALAFSWYARGYRMLNNYRS